jgi:hypothetical protein
MKNLFLVSSAINAKHGIYTPRERFLQTYESCKSIKDRCHNADIILIDGGLKPINDGQQEKLSKYVHEFMYYGDHPRVKEIQQSNNHDIVKNLIEIFMFMDVLNKSEFSEYSRIFKMSGRYTLNENFDINKHNDPIVIRGPYTSQFPPQVTGGLELQYMSRLWSFDISQHQHVAEVYKKMFDHMITRLEQGGYVDIEHLLYHYLDKSKVVNVDKVGVSGNIAPNGYGVEE